MKVASYCLENISGKHNNNYYDWLSKKKWKINMLNLRLSHSNKVLK